MFSSACYFAIGQYTCQNVGHYAVAVLLRRLPHCAPLGFEVNVMPVIDGDRDVLGSVMESQLD